MIITNQILISDEIQTIISENNKNSFFSCLRTLPYKDNKDSREAAFD